MSLFKKLIPIRTSAKRSTPLVTPAISESNLADQWLWSALDVARRAAMADDLAHVPSIKKIADIFTRMLGGLQAMKSNRDRFYLITNEIGSLIESVVRYGREHKTTSERYRTLCDDFLSTISSMQSEMELIFASSRISAKRFSKANAHQDVLSAYQFRIRTLRSDLQALMMTTTSGFFSSASGFVVSGGVFSEVQGNQYIFHNHGTTDIQTFLTGVGQTSTGRTDDLDFSNYTVLKYGDLRPISVPQEGYLKTSDEYTVRIHDWTLTARTYKGNSALQSFKEDVKMILEHNFRHPHVVQLFGVCLSKKVPTLIFHGDLRFLDHRDLALSRGSMEPREYWYQIFRMNGESQAAFRYLMREYQSLDPNHMFLTPEGQFVRHTSTDAYIMVYGYLPDRVLFYNCSCYFYLDESLHLQISIEPLPKTPGATTITIFPKLPLHDMEVIKDALQSNETIPDGSQIDRKGCLLAIYDYMICMYGLHFINMTVQDPVILVSRMRYVGAARLELGLCGDDCFTWTGWMAEMEGFHVTIENVSWTRFTVPRTASSDHWAEHPKIRCRSMFSATSLYLKAFLAQWERIVSQIASYSTSRKHHILMMTRIECNIVFQSRFSPPSSFQGLDEVYLFVRDLQDVDDAFEIQWFWAKDPQGLQHLSPADMVALGLDEPHQLKVYVNTGDTGSYFGVDIRLFHELFGFAVESLEIPRFLDLPIASVEWDGDENGPLTPWELLTLDYNEHREEINRLMCE